MNRDLLIKLLTGIFAKLIRYGLTAAGGTAAINGASGEAVNFEQLAAGAASIAVAIGWSVWEDRVKRRAAAGQQAAPGVISFDDLKDELGKPRTPPVP